MITQSNYHDHNICTYMNTNKTCVATKLWVVRNKILSSNFGCKDSNDFFAHKIDLPTSCTFRGYGNSSINEVSSWRKKNTNLSSVKNYIHNFDNVMTASSRGQITSGIYDLNLRFLQLHQVPIAAETFNLLKWIALINL